VVGGAAHKECSSIVVRCVGWVVVLGLGVCGVCIGVSEALLFSRIGEPHVGNRRIIHEGGS
jgi:hypothetical protein